MVSLKDVRESNSNLKSNSGSSGLVAVFVGGTSGVGESTIKQLAIHASTPKVYIVGRSEASASRIIEEVKKLNPGASFSFIKADVSVLQSVDAVCKEIKQKEDKLNMLFLSSGYLTFAGRNGGTSYIGFYTALHKSLQADLKSTENADGLDDLFALRYYSRMRFIHNLLPLLNSSSPARVVSILAGGQEGKIHEDDLELKNNYSMMNCATHTSTMTSFAMEELAAQNPSISFIHAFPGIVKTNIFSSGFSAPVAFLMRWVVGPLLTPFAVAVSESGERQLFHSTSARYPPAGKSSSGVALPAGVEVAKGSNGEKGSGVYLLNWNGETVGNEKLLGDYRDKGMGETIWNHTLAVFDRIIASKK